MSEKHTAKSLFRKAMEEFLGQKYEASIESLDQAVALDPAFKLAFLSRGSAHFKVNHDAEALDDFNRVVELDPENARAYHLRGLVYERTGDHQSALSDFSKAIDLDPQYGAAYYSRANLHSKMGAADLATEDIQMATHLTEVNIETFANENNVWRSQQLRVEEMGGADPMVR